MPDRILFTRHGQTIDNLHNRLSAAIPGAELNSDGIEQARTLAKLMSPRRLTAIYASPLRRAVQTASITAQAKSLAIIIDNNLREMSCGTYEGRNDPDVYRHLDYVWRAWTDTGDLTVKAGPDGESGEQILDRSISALARISRDHPTGTVLVVTHSGVISLLVPYICSNLELNFGYSEWIGNGELVELEPHGDGYRCISWACRAVPDAHG